LSVVSWNPTQARFFEGFKITRGSASLINFPPQICRFFWFWFPDTGKYELAELQEKWHSTSYSHVFWTNSLVCWNYTQNRKKVTRNWGEICKSPSTDHKKEAQVAQRNFQKFQLRKKYITLELLYLQDGYFNLWGHHSPLLPPLPPPFQVH
jgi:hypothetical protein